MIHLVESACDRRYFLPLPPFRKFNHLVSWCGMILLLYFRLSSPTEQAGEKRELQHLSCTRSSQSLYSLRTFPASVYPTYVPSLTLNSAIVTDIVLGQTTEVPLQLLTANIHILDIKQDVEHAAWEGSIAGNVDPLVCCRALNADVAGPHDALFAGVEDELEKALDDDAVVKAKGAVQGRLDAGGEVAHARYGAVVDVQAGLNFCVNKLTKEGCQLV